MLHAWKDLLMLFQFQSKIEVVVFREYHFMFYFYFSFVFFNFTQDAVFLYHGILKTSLEIPPDFLPLQKFQGAEEETQL